MANLYNTQLLTNSNLGMLDVCRNVPYTHDQPSLGNLCDCAIWILHCVFTDNKQVQNSYSSFRRGYLLVF